MFNHINTHFSFDRRRTIPPGAGQVAGPRDGVLVRAIVRREARFVREGLREGLRMSVSHTIEAAAEAEQTHSVASTLLLAHSVDRTDLALK